MSAHSLVADELAPDVHISPVQLLLAASSATHAFRVMLAVLAPVVARMCHWRCLAADASHWDSFLCSLSTMPLVQLVLLQMLILLGAYALLSVQPELVHKQVCPPNYSLDLPHSEM